MNVATIFQTMCVLLLLLWIRPALGQNPVDLVIEVTDLAGRAITDKGGNKVPVEAAIARLPASASETLASLQSNLGQESLAELRSGGLLQFIGETITIPRNNQKVKGSNDPQPDKGTIPLDPQMAKVPKTKNGPALPNNELENQTVVLFFQRKNETVTAIVPYVVARNQTLVIAVPDASEMARKLTPSSPQVCPPSVPRTRFRLFHRFRCAVNDAAAGTRDVLAGLTENGVQLAASYRNVAMSVAEASMRTSKTRKWTNSDGSRVVLATLVDVQGDIAVFQRPDGSRAKAQLQDLSSADLFVINRWQMMTSLAQIPRQDFTSH